MKNEILFPSEVWNTIKLYLFENSYININIDEYDTIHDNEVFLHYGVMKHILPNKTNILSICLVDLHLYIPAGAYLFLDTMIHCAVKNDLFWVKYETNIFNKNSEYTYYIMNTLNNHNYLAPSVQVYIKSFYNKNKFIIRRKILNDNLYNCLLQEQHTHLDYDDII